MLPTLNQFIGETSVSFNKARLFRRNGLENNQCLTLDYRTVLKYFYIKLLHVVVLNVINGEKYLNFGQSLTSLFIMLTIHSSLVLTERRTMAHGLVRINSPPSDHIRLKTKFKIDSNIYRYLGAEVYEVQ